MEWHYKKCSDEGSSVIERYYKTEVLTHLQRSGLVRKTPERRDPQPETLP